MASGPARQRIEVTCPQCAHLQAEPGIVVSTACRSCGFHFQVREGKAVTRPKPTTRFAVDRSDEADSEPPPEPTKPLSPFRRPDPPVQRPQTFIQRMLGKNPKPRRVVCFDCSVEHTTVGDAQSSQCPACGAYISLRNYLIDDRWNRRIQTRGDVVIQKNGAVSGAPIVCHNLTVLGELAAAVDCSGDLVIRSHGRIPGNVRCDTLRVERGAKVEFLNAIHASDVLIDGMVTGQIHCSGIITLEKRAKLNGLVQAARLVVKQGASHNGSMEIITPDSGEISAPDENEG
jgi:cytoskeletal protein CcmA (bactofilin family)